MHDEARHKLRGVLAHRSPGGGAVPAPEGAQRPAPEGAAPSAPEGTQPYAPEDTDAARRLLDSLPGVAASLAGLVGEDEALELAGVLALVAERIGELVDGLDAAAEEELEEVFAALEELVVSLSRAGDAVGLGVLGALAPGVLDRCADFCGPALWRLSAELGSGALDPDAFLGDEGGRR